MPKAVILMYHNIDTPPKGARIPNLYVTPRMFRFQMWYLKIAGFEVVTLQDLVASISEGAIKNDLVALTFDDGYLDFYKNAYPILKQYGYPSTVFVVSGLVGGNNDWDSKKENIKKPLMDWDRIKEITKNGVEIGSHTRTHPELTRISAEERIREIVGSKQDLEERLNKQIEMFCYPGGDNNHEVKETVKKAGYRYAVVTQRGHVEQGFDPYALRRIPIKLITNPFSFFYKIHTDSERRKGKQK